MHSTWCSQMLITLEAKQCWKVMSSFRASTLQIQLLQLFTPSCLGTAGLQAARQLSRHPAPRNSTLTFNHFSAPWFWESQPQVNNRVPKYIPCLSWLQLFFHFFKAILLSREKKKNYVSVTILSVSATVPSTLSTIPPVFLTFLQTAEGFVFTSAWLKTYGAAFQGICLLDAMLKGSPRSCEPPWPCVPFFHLLCWVIICASLPLWLNIICQLQSS
jgi:hypothetical protein